MTNNIKYNCIFGGGGIRGMCYVGAIKALKEFNIELNSIAGSSVGAVFAALYAIGYSEDEIKDLFFDFNINMFRDLNISIFTTDISISKGEIFLEWLREKIEKKFYGENYKKGSNKPVKFKDISKNLHILTIDLNTNTPYIFSKESTPEEEIAFAVRASASLPGLMKPINIGDAILVDGDLIKSWPAWKVYNSLDNSNSRILEFRLEGSRKERDIKNPMDYVSSIINTIWYLSTENVFNMNHSNDRYDYIVIDTKDIILFDFTIDKNIKNELIEKGYNDTKKYLCKILPEKKKIIIEYYKEILEKLLAYKKHIKEGNIDKALFIINDILSEMPQKTEYIDKYFFTQINDLKDILKINAKKIFFIKKKVDNEKQIISRIEFVENILKERINELKTYITNFCNNF